MILAVAVLGALCDPPEPAAVRDPDDSAAYAAVGDDARGSDVRTAAIAYRKAIALDPDNAHAREQLAALCTADRTPDELAAAIATYRDGDLDAAARRLRALVDREPGPAHFFLGLIAVARHDRRGAERELALAAIDPAYATLVRDTLRGLRRDGAVSAAVLATGEVDTNPELVPDTPPQGATLGPPTPDEAALVGGTITVRPTPWLALRDLTSYRALRTRDDLDFFSETAEAVAELARDRVHAAVTYDFDYDMLGGTSYLVANRATVGARRDSATFAPAASYTLQRRDYLQSAQAGFTGWVNSGEAGGTLHVTPVLDLAGFAIASHETTADPTFTDTAAGARAEARLRATPRVRVTADVAGWYASYDAAEPDGTLRRDGHVEGELRVEVDLADLVTAIAGAAAAWNDSTVADFNYTRWVARLGIAVALGAP